MPASPLPADAEPKKNGSPGKKKADKTNNMNGNDFAKAIGINKPANVRDKIKRWQQDGGADAAAAGGAAAAGATVAGAEENAEPESKPPKPKSQPTTPKMKPMADKPNWKPAHTPNKSADRSPERPDTAAKKAPAHNELDEDVQSAVAPKKRVVSDSHWRAKTSPPKDAARPAPKTIPNAWVRPSRIVKKDRAAAVPEEPIVAPPTPKTPQTPQTPHSPQLPQTLANYIGKSTNQKKGSQRQRRPSKPTSNKSSGNEERPVSSGSGSAQDLAGVEVIFEPESPKRKKEKAEIVKVRRRNTRTSPRGSLSAEDAEPVKHRPARKSEPAADLGELANLITVEYDESTVVDARQKVTSPRADELRERRRRRRPKSQPGTDDEGFRESTRRHRRTRTDTIDLEKEEVMREMRAQQPRVLSPPNKEFATRLEAWLDRTQQTQEDAGSSERRPPRRRRRSKESAQESVSTLDLSSTMRTESSIVTATTEDRDEPALPELKPTDKAPVEERPRSSGSSGGSSRRRRRRRSHEQRKASRELKIDTSVAVPEQAVSVVSDDTAVTPVPEKADAEPETPLSPTPTLKRRGAKRSQHLRSKSRSSPLRESMSTDDLAREDNPLAASVASSAPSSSVDAASIDFEQISLKPRPLSIQRHLPTRGKRLSTIASVDSFPSKVQEAPASGVAGSELSDSVMSDDRTVTASEVGSQLNETSTIVSRRSTRKNRLASHADLISVLSMPKAGAKSIVSARSIRTNRSRLATATIPDIMKELANDETKYMRELRTIVDGVIPVLLSCVLSKDDSAVAAGLFSRSAKSDPSEVTKPIMDMGVCLERLKTLHKRVPKEDTDSFLSWAQSAQRVYGDYIGVWRLGFQDVVISLAPADDEPFKPAKIVNGPDDGAPWDEGMPRNAEGYVVNGDGERVDVAYMLKRPLVRLKYLAKTLKVS